MSATVFRKPLETFFNKNPFIHVSTFGGSELGAEVTLKVLEISSEPKFLKNVNQMAEYLSKGYKVLAGKYHDHIVGFRQLGLMTGIEFRTENYGLLFTKAAYQSGLFTLYSNNDKRVCQLLPPLIIGKEQVDEIIHKIDIAIPKLKLYNIAFSIKEFIDNLKVF